MNAYKLAASVLLAVATSAASAAPIYVGSWDLYSGVSWITGQAPTYTGQQAAAALFGGLATDYAISTDGEDVSDINFSAWYDGYAVGPHIAAQDFHIDTGTLGVYDSVGDSSAMIMDNAGGEGLMNYAFRVSAASVPEPMPMALMGLGLAALAFTRRPRRK